MSPTFSRTLGAYLNVTDDKAGVQHRSDHYLHSDIYAAQPESHHQALQKLSAVVLHDLKASLRQMTMVMTTLEGELVNTEDTSPATRKALDNMNAVFDRTRRIIKYLHELVTADQL